MEDSILTSTKKNLGVGEADTAFDLDIITHINATFSIVNQIGVGPPGFSIEDDTANWVDLSLPVDQLSNLKTLMYVSVRLLFDPPTTSFNINAIEKQRDEFLTRLSYLREVALAEDDEEDDVGLSDPAASGTQATPAIVWIMDHNLGYNPAGFQFRDEDGNEIEPQSITYVNLNRSLATWPVAIAGDWNVS